MPPRPAQSLAAAVMTTVAVAFVLVVLVVLVALALAEPAEGATRLCTDYPQSADLHWRHVTVSGAELQAALEVVGEAPDLELAHVVARVDQPGCYLVTWRADLP